MTPFMIYLLVGTLWAALCKWSGEIDKQLEERGTNTLGWQLGITIVIILFWAPVLVVVGLEKRKGE
ncbi:hypothetical protein [Bacillus thuringiensis]|uniref:hypothetical protein n=1 Tax=Bacillus thuringiensis TaxID=1428 RepID=UPI000BFB4DBF|nr:hypothetical protein [Bacillus thuringiensis]PGM47393.1 hypothetical protein CN937_03735 [Bacillus thuringiensis]